MMRKFLLFVLILTIAWLLFSGGEGSKQTKGRILQRLSYTINFVAWSLLVIYGCAFIYWLFKEIF